LHNLLHSPTALAVTIDRRSGSAIFDFSGTGAEVFANTNAPRAVTYSAVIYCLRCFVGRDVPLNQGCLAPVEICIPDGTLLSPSPTAAVVGGNVLTSQRVTDVILRAFGAAAASQGCMNNLTFGDASVGYYETICGGAGAGPTVRGVDAAWVRLSLCCAAHPHTHPHPVFSGTAAAGFTLA
jgi:5-oxoprolinase (ATP-hydrolysing)